MAKQGQAVAKAGEQEASRLSDITGVARDFRDVVIVGISFLALGLIAGNVINHYTDSKDAVAVLGVIVPVISAIAVGAFGLVAGAAAGAAGKKAAEAQATAAEARATSAKSDLAKHAAVAQALKPQVDKLVSAIESTFSTLEEKLPSPAGQRAFYLPANQMLPHDLRLEGDQFETVRAQLASVRSGIDFLSGTSSGVGEAPQR